MIAELDPAQLFEREPLANWNGVLMPLSAARVSVLDRAFLFGDAIYEVIRIYHGKPFLYDDHLARLHENLQKLAIPADSKVVSTRIRKTLAASDVESGIIYIQVTRGVARRAHRYPDPPPTPNILIYVAHLSNPYQEVRQRGGTAIIIEDLRWKRCDIKSVNLLANCMAAQQVYEAGCVEGLFVNDSNQLTEGTHTSLFGVRDGNILTTPLGDHILPGITRKFLFRLAAECGIELTEEMIHRDDLGKLDELFITGTTSEILPITKVDQQTIGSGIVGPVTRQLQEAYRHVIKNLAIT